MKKFAAILLVSLFLGAGTAYASNVGDSPQQQMPQGKIVINVPPPETDWLTPTIGAVGAIAVALVGYGLRRRSRKED